MPLQEEFRASGEWLFRWRSYIPIIPLVWVVLVTLMSSYHRADKGQLDTSWEMLCVSVSLLGLAIRVMTVGFVPRGTSGRIKASQQAHALNTTGMYSIVRHPLYLGNFIIWIGVAMFPRVWWLIVVIGLFFCVLYERIMLAEEEFLRETFGETYLAWARSTPAFLPRLSGWLPPSLPFSFRTVLRRENSGFLGIIATFWLLDLLSDYAVRGTLGLRPIWLAIFAISFAIYVSLRFLKRRGLLEVSGR